MVATAEFCCRYQVWPSLSLGLWVNKFRSTNKCMAKPELCAMFPVVPIEESLKRTGWVDDGGTHFQPAHSPFSLLFQMLPLYSWVRAKLASSDLLCSSYSTWPVSWDYNLQCSETMVYMELLFSSWWALNTGLQYVFLNYTWLPEVPWERLSVLHFPYVWFPFCGLGMPQEQGGMLFPLVLWLRWRVELVEWDGLSYVRHSLA